MPADDQTPSRGKLVVLTGPSGVGKGSVVSVVRKRHPKVWLSVSATTRQPRPGETNGVEYFFVDRTEFLRMIDQGELLEWAEYAGNLYGTPRAAVLDRLNQGEHALLEIELDGARQVRRAMPEAFFVFLAPPSWAELERRLVGRKTDQADAVARRLDAAKVELDAAEEFDAVVVNDVVERAADELVDLIAAHPVRRGHASPADDPQSSKGWSDEVVRSRCHP